MGASLATGRAGDHDVLAEMNATPLIDVMLVLLIMLIITIPIQNHSVVLGIQGSDHPVVRQQEVVNIDVDFDGAVLWNGEIVADRSALESRLQAIGSVPDYAQAEVHLRPNKLASYKTVAAVLASAQRMGVVKIGVVGAEQFL